MQSDYKSVGELLADLHRVGSDLQNGKAVSDEDRIKLFLDLLGVISTILGVKPVARRVGESVSLEIFDPKDVDWNFSVDVFESVDGPVYDNLRLERIE